MTTTVNGIEEFHKLAGEHIGWSDWQLIDQERVNLFADATGDHQWIHVDPERASDGSVRRGDRPRLSHLVARSRPLG